MKKYTKYIIYFYLLLSISIALADEKKDTFEYYKNQGMVYFYKKQYHKAMKFFEKALNKNENDKESNIFYGQAMTKTLSAMVHIDRAKVQLKEARYNNALKSLEMAEKISPFEPQIKSLRKKILEKKEEANPFENISNEKMALFNSTLKSAEVAYNKGENDKALELYAYCLSIVPKETRALEGFNKVNQRRKEILYTEKLQKLFIQADNFFKKKKYIMALAKYKEILNYDHTNDKAVKQKNIIEEKLTQIREETEKEEAVKNYLFSGKQYLKQKQFDLAVEQFEYGFDTDKEEKFAKWKMWINKTKTQKAEFERKQFSSVLSLINNYFEKGLQYQLTGKFKEAISSFENVKRLSNKYAKKNKIIAEMQKSAIENLEKAKENLLKKEEEEVSVESPYFNLVQTLKYLGLNAFNNHKYKKSKKYFANILELFPKNKFAYRYFSLCDIKINPNRKKKVINDLIKQIEIALKKDKMEAARLIDIALNVDSENETLQRLKKQFKQKFKRKKIYKNKAQLDSMYKKAYRLYRRNPKQSKKICHNVLKINQNYMRCKTLLAKIEAQTGNISLGTKKFTPKPQARKFYVQGMRHYNAGRIKKAVFSFQSALSIDRNYKRAKIALYKCKRYLQ